MKTVVPDVIRLTLLVAAGLVLIWLAGSHLSAVGLPAAAAPPVEFAGCAFIATALAHVLRRVLFHRVDLQHFAHRAYEHPIGAGLVVLGLCMVIQALMPIITLMLTKG